MNSVVAFHLHNNNRRRLELTLATIDALRHFLNSSSYQRPNSQQQGHNSNHPLQVLVLEDYRLIVAWLIDLLNSVAAAAEVDFVDLLLSHDAPFSSKCLPTTPIVPFPRLMGFLDHPSCME